MPIGEESKLFFDAPGLKFLLPEAELRGGAGTGRSGEALTGDVEGDDGRRREKDGSETGGYRKKRLCESERRRAERGNGEKEERKGQRRQAGMREKGRRWRSRGRRR